MKLPESKIKPLIKLSSGQADLKTISPTMVLDYLDEQMKLRELPLEAHIKKALKK